MKSRHRIEPPSGSPPPTSADLPDGTTVQLLPLAEEVCRRYRQEFPDEEERYGLEGMAACVDDNLHLFSWAVLELLGDVDFQEQVNGLTDALKARDFPVDRLARNLEIASDVALDQIVATAGEPVAKTMRSAAARARTQGNDGPADPGSDYVSTDEDSDYRQEEGGEA